jgi:hypothetical protein
MSSVIQSKNEKEKRASQAEERRKREKARMKQLGGNGVNGTATPEDDEEEHDDKVQALPTRGHVTKASRTMSPAPGRENGYNQSGPGAKDSFLNYFFGKEGGLPPSGPGMSTNMGSRHVSHSTEPSFSQSIRRQERGSFAERTANLPSYGRDDEYTNASEYGDHLFVSYYPLKPQVSRSKTDTITARTIRRTSTYRARSPRDRAHPPADLFILQYRPRDHRRSSPQSNHASSGQSFTRRGTKPSGQ